MESSVSMDPALGTAQRCRPRDVIFTRIRPQITLLYSPAHCRVTPRRNARLPGPFQRLRWPPDVDVER